MGLGAKSKERRKYRCSKTVVFGILAFFRHFQMQKVNIKINRMKRKIERLVCSVFCFIETICTFIRYHYFYPQSLLIINNEFSVFRATPSLRLIFLARIVKSKHEIRGIHFNFCTISLLIHQFNILNRLHILTSVS